MRILVTLLLDTLPMLGNVLLLCFFVFFIFGIVGVQLWAGLLRNRCFLDGTFVRCEAPPTSPAHNKVWVASTQRCLRSSPTPSRLCPSSSIPNRLLCTRPLSL